MKFLRAKILANKDTYKLKSNSICKVCQNAINLLQPIETYYF